ncbi:hypothetical protein GN956_G12004 [Arapaima gigas]
MCWAPWFQGSRLTCLNQHRFHILVSIHHKVSLAVPVQRGGEMLCSWDRDKKQNPFHQHFCIDGVEVAWQLVAGMNHFSIISLLTY